MEGYSTKILEASKELTNRERIKLKEMNDGESLDLLTANGNRIEINPDFYAIISVHSPRVTRITPNM